MSQQQDDVRGQAVINRESRKLDRAKARAQSLEENMQDTLAALLKKQGIKRALAKDAMDATNHPERRDKILDEAGGGIFKADHEVITGNEPRPWER